MNQLHEGQDYKLYKIYVWGGLAAIVIYILVAVMVFDLPGTPGSSGFLVTITPMVKEMTQEDGIPTVSALKNWNTLQRAMTIHGGSVAEYVRNAKKANTPLIIWFGSVNLLPIWIFGFIILGSLGVIPASKFMTMLYGVFAWIGLMIFGTPFLFGWGKESAERAYLAPLGLALTQTPRISPTLLGMMGGGQAWMPAGPAIAEGERHGRRVHIEMIDRFCLTALEAHLPEFQIQSREGKLTPDESAPQAARDALRSLRKAKRWAGITVFCGSAGIAIRRESKGSNMWLYDLWLVEYLIEAMN
jgi:hypothetical protein